VVGWGIVRIFAYPRYSISKRSGYLLHFPIQGSVWKMISANFAFTEF
jgi:hypothetical protein